MKLYYNVPKGISSHELAKFLLRLPDKPMLSGGDYIRTIADFGDAISVDDSNDFYFDSVEDGSAKVVELHIS